MDRSNEGDIGPNASEVRGGPHGPWPVELLAYAAAVVDSDGSIGIRLDTYAMRVRKLKAGPVYKERVTLKQIEPQAVDLLHEAFGGSRFISAPQSERAQPLHSLQIVDRMASTFLAAILPYLLIKRRQAELCLERVAMGDLRAEILRLNQVEGRATRISREDVGKSDQPKAGPADS